MNNGSWTNPTDACSLQGAGANGNDRITRVQYDAVGRQSLVTAAYGTGDASNVASTTYTLNGQVATQTDAMGSATTYGYDGFDRRNAMYLPSPQQGAGSSNGSDYEVYAYDANGNLTARRTRDNQTISYTYDALNRMTNDGQGHSFAYDLLGHLTSANDGNNAFENFTWDALGRKTSESAAYGGTSTMQYDAAGRRTRLTWADGFYVTYDYDTLGEMTGIHENGGTLLASLSYDDLGRRMALTRPNGTSTTYSYDGASRLSALNLNGGPSNGYGFAYNPAGQITSRTSSNDAFAWTGAVNVNRGYTTNGLNQYTQSGNVTPSYDGRGNLTSAGGATYGYNLQNQMTTFSGGYIYRNALGQWLDVNTEQQWMVHDDDRTIEEYGYDGTVHRRYVYGPGVDEPLVWYEGSGTNDRRFLHADERGSIVAVSDSNGGTIAINSYDEFGIPGANNVGRFQYTGQRWIPALGMYDYKARMYSPTFGRFLQTDPIGYGDGMNWYNYVGGDPVNRFDPTGLRDDLINSHVLPYNPNEMPPDIVVTANPLPPSPPPPPPPPPNLIAIGFSGDFAATGESNDPSPQKDIVVTARRCLRGAGNINGAPIAVPPGHSLSEFAGYGEAARGSVSAYTNLANFRRGGSWDTQRIGGQFHMEYRDFANVAIGVYGAAAGLSADSVLAVSNGVAKFGHYNEPMSRLYPSMPQANVYNELEGYSLYKSGKLGDGPC